MFSPRSRDTARTRGDRLSYSVIAGQTRHSRQAGRLVPDPDTFGSQSVRVEVGTLRFSGIGSQH